MESVAAWIERLMLAGARPEDSHEERLRNGTLVLAASLMAALAVVWTGTYFALGLVLSAAIPLGYQLITAATLVVYWRTGAFRFFCASQLALALVLPFLLQWSLGGFVESSAVSLWAFVAALEAMIVLGARPAVPWFAAFLALTAVSGPLESVLPSRAEQIPSEVQVAFFGLNVAGLTTTVFVALQYFLRALVRERERSEQLLLNILPGPIADRLKASEETVADDADEVTVLFADLVGFTGAADRLSAREVVTLLNEVFTSFDELVERSGLEKIKTIGDGYMVAAGIPRARRDHAEAAADLALAMMDRVATLPGPQSVGLKLRIGMDSGPVVAGVIGRSKFSYDLWGDTVNTASRMQSHAAPGEIQVTERAFARLRASFALEEREVLDVKGKGSMRAFVLRGRRGGT